MTPCPEVRVRKALLTDVPSLLDLINRYAAQGLMLARTEIELAENIRDFTVAEACTQVVGCVALHFYGLNSAEVRSLAVHPEWQGRGVASQLMHAIEAEALEHRLRVLFAFTYIPGFFTRFGFEEIDRRLLPSKVWKDCLRCPKLTCCDEIAMQKLLPVSWHEQQEASTSTHSGGAAGLLSRPGLGDLKP